MLNLNKIIKTIKQNKLIALFILTGTLLTWIAGTTDSFSKVVVFFDGFFPKKPKIISFALDKTKTSFEETYEDLFGINSNQPFRTFSFTPRSLSSTLPPYAIFYIAIKNESKKELFITSIKFNVKDIGDVKGGAEAVLEPVLEDWFEIEWEKNSPLNNMKKPLKRTISIDSLSAKAFNIGIYTKAKAFGLCWKLNIEFFTSLGSVCTEDFQIILSKSNLSNL